MALPDNEQPDRKPDQKPDKKEKFFTKLIIRRLPPSMDQDTFKNQISPIPSYDYLYFVRGDPSLGEFSFSRAYINFTDANDVFDFKEKFDNYIFVDGAGHEYAAVVEFAAFQKIPKKRNQKRVDPKCASIEQDQYYLDFVDMLNKPAEPDEKPEYTYQIVTENKNDTTTPLLEYLKNKRAEKSRLREERREERKRKEFERKKYDDRKKRYDDKSPPKKTTINKADTDKKFDGDAKTGDNKQEKDDDKPPYYKNKEKRFDDRKKDGKNKYPPPRKDHADKREFKSRRDDYRDYRPKHDEFNKKEADPNKVQQKRVKKYSEKREERKIEAQKKLQQQQEQDPAKLESAGEPAASKTEEHKIEAAKDDDRPDKSGRAKDADCSQRRIRNKDRPTIAIYRPGMLSKRRQSEVDADTKEAKKE